jgi:hypothetical protein
MADADDIRPGDVFFLPAEHNEHRNGDITVMIMAITSTSDRDLVTVLDTHRGPGLPVCQGPERFVL